MGIAASIARRRKATSKSVADADILNVSGRRCYVVGRSEAPRGIITLNDVLATPRDEWSRTPNVPSRSRGAATKKKMKNAEVDLQR